MTVCGAAPVRHPVRPRGTGTGIAAGISAGTGTARSVHGRRGNGKAAAA